MDIHKKTILKSLAIALILSSTAHAQTVTNADQVDFQPTILRDELGFKACGIRVVAIVSLPKNSFEAYDFSMTIWKNKVTGILKGGKHVVLAGGLSKNTIVQPGPTGIWVAKSSSGTVVRGRLMQAGDAPGFTLGAADAEDVATMLFATSNGESIQFSMKYPGDRYEKIIAIQKPLSAPDRKTFSDCFSGLTAAMKEDQK